VDASELKRVADALEHIAGQLVFIAHPLGMPAPRDTLPAPGVPAHQAFLSGMFKRRQGDALYDTPANPAKVKAHPNSPVDGYLKPDKPVIDK
jgi:hypothetical protein